MKHKTAAARGAAGAGGAPGAGGGWPRDVGDRDREGAAAGGGEVAALTDKGDSLWGKASGRAGRVQRRRMWRTFVSKIFILLPPKQKEERRHKPKLFGNNCLLFTN